MRCFLEYSPQLSTTGQGIEPGRGVNGRRAFEVQKQILRASWGIGRAEEMSALYQGSSSLNESSCILHMMCQVLSLTVASTPLHNVRFLFGAGVVPMILFWVSSMNASEVASESQPQLLADYL